MEGLYIGTSGWVYKGWAGSFYPEDLPAKRQFEYYASQFPTVEINNTFYRLPTERAVRGWRDKAPEGFIFGAKGSRFITQMKKLNISMEQLNRFLRLIVLLDDHLGPLLWQLPPQFGLNLPRLERFLEMLPRDLQHAVEFRHPSWITNRVFDCLRRFGVAYAPVSSMRMPPHWTCTANFVYVRFHGLEAGAAHDYTRAQLKPWAEHIRAALKDKLQAYVYFNNDWNTRAPKNAQELHRLVERASKRRSRRLAVPA